LSTDPQGRTNAKEDHIARDFPENDRERHKLLAEIELALSNADVSEEEIRASIANIACLDVSIFEAT
jgi:hypothetical protein